MEHLLEALAPAKMDDLTRVVLIRDLKKEGCKGYIYIKMQGEEAAGRLGALGRGMREKGGDGSWQR